MIHHEIEQIDMPVRVLQTTWKNWQSLDGQSICVINLQ